MPTTGPHRPPSLPPCTQPRPGLGFGGAQAPLLSLPLPKITPYEAMGLVGPGLPRDECLPAYWTPRRAEGPSPPDVQACLRGIPPRVSVPGQRGACPEWCSEFWTQGMSIPPPSPTAFLSFCLIPTGLCREMAWNRARTLRLAGDPGAASHPSSPAPYRLPLFSRPQLPSPSKGALALCLDC